MMTSQGRCPDDAALGRVAYEEFYGHALTYGVDAPIAWKLVAAAVADAVIDAADLARLRAVDAAAREWYEADAVIAVFDDSPSDQYPPGALERLYRAADAVLALYAPSSPVVSPATPEGE